MQRKITGFHLDEEGHWVAELECGHNQHVRHDPPYVERPWVITEHGRRSRLGQELNCVRCDEDRYATTRLGGSDMALVSFGDDRALAIRDHILPLLREYGALQVQRDTEADGWNYPPVRKLRRHRPHRKPMAANNPKTEESIADEPEPGGTGPFGSMNRCRKVAWEDHAAPERRQDGDRPARALEGAGSGWRSFWRQNAIGMPTVGIASTRCGLVTRELHPDFCNGGQLEKLMRQECFKKLWPEIERIAEQR